MKQKALLIQNNDIESELIRVKLESLGYSVLVYRAIPQNIIKTVTEELPDVVIIDPILSGQSGIEAAEILKGDKDTAKIPLYLVVLNIHGLSSLDYSRIKSSRLWEGVVTSLVNLNSLK